MIVDRSCNGQENVLVEVLSKFRADVGDNDQEERQTRQDNKRHHIMVIIAKVDGSKDESVPKVDQVQHGQKANKNLQRKDSVV